MEETTYVGTHGRVCMRDVALFSRSICTRWDAGERTVWRCRSPDDIAEDEKLENSSKRAIQVTEISIATSGTKQDHVSGDSRSYLWEICKQLYWLLYQIKKPGDRIVAWYPQVVVHGLLPGLFSL
jgi:hypothetical protein